MNINKHLILLFSVLFFLFAVSVSSGCFRKNESDVKSVVRNELDQLKISIQKLRKNTYPIQSCSPMPQRILI